MQAYYDPKTDTIIGATPGTWAYAHEERHRQQYHALPWLERVATILHIYGYYGSIFSVIYITIYIKRLWWVAALAGIGFGMLPHILLITLIELDAYLMGTINHLRGRT